jgi:hypothetical protein
MKMKYLVDISQKHAQKIHKLVELGQYDGVAQFITVAVENQLYLEESGLKSLSNNIAIIEPENHVPNNSKTVSAKGVDNIKLINIKSNPQMVSVPSFKQLTLGQQNNDEEKVWLWGQINKIFPVKIGVRILFRELGDNRLILFNDFVDKAAEEAANIGQVIRAYEDSYGKIRDEKISAGLPKIDDEKSQTRYKAHFLAYCRKDRLLDGAMALLRFSNIELEGSNKRYLIGLTGPGLKFAKINSPVLDNGDFKQSLSQEEANFYLDHVKQNVRSEYAAIIWVLEKINKGFKEREGINEELRNDFGKQWQASDAVINTQRSGIMARMFELGLLDKEKNGIYVTYLLSDFGKSFITKNKTNE